MADVELRRVVGEMFDRASGKVRRVGWDMDILLLHGKQIATINRVPGAPIGLIPGVQLTPSERQAVEEAIAVERGGIKPASIGTPVKVPYELLDDEDDPLISATIELNDGEDDE